MSEINNETVTLLEQIKLQKEEIEKLNESILCLKQFINGEWVDTDIICELLNIDFGEGLKRFDFSRTAEWNPYPLNGQKITTKFKLGDEKRLTLFADTLVTNILQTINETKKDLLSNGTRSENDWIY